MGPLKAFMVQSAFLLISSRAPHAESSRVRILIVSLQPIYALAGTAMQET